MLAVAGVIINSGRFWFYRGSLDRRAFGIVLLSALPFLVLGTWIYSILDARTVGTVLGLTVIATVPARRFLQHRKIVLNSAGLAAGAGVFGLANGVATGTGMIQIAVLLGAGLTGPAVLATDALATILLDLCKAARAGFLRRGGHRHRQHPRQRAGRMAGEPHPCPPAHPLHGSAHPVRRRLHAVAFLALRRRA